MMGKHHLRSTGYSYERRNFFYHLKFFYHFFYHLNFSYGWQFVFPTSDWQGREIICSVGFICYKLVTVVSLLGVRVDGMSEAEEW